MRRALQESKFSRKLLPQLRGRYERMEHMTQQERETLIRAAGIIDGIACCAREGTADALVSALEMIDGVLEGVEQDATD